MIRGLAENGFVPGLVKGGLGLPAGKPIKPPKGSWKPVGTFWDLQFYKEGDYYNVRYAYSGDTGAIYYLKFRIYQTGFQDASSRPRFFYKKTNPALAGTVTLHKSQIVDEDSGVQFGLVPGQSWVHVWWGSFNYTYGRADSILKDVTPPPQGSPPTPEPEPTPEPTPPDETDPPTPPAEAGIPWYMIALACGAAGLIAVAGIAAYQQQQQMMMLLALR